MDARDKRGHDGEWVRTRRILLATHKRPRHLRVRPGDPIPSCEMRGMERREALFSFHARANKPAQFAPPDCGGDARLAKRARLSALHRGVLAGWTGYLPASPGPRLRAQGFAPCAVQRAPRARPVVAVGRGPEAPRERGLRLPARAGAPHPLRHPDVSRRRPSGERDA